MKGFILVTFVSLWCGSHQLPEHTKWRPHDSDMLRDATELITSKGYPCENYWITTEDGYILNNLRIPYGRNEQVGSSNVKPVVVLQHGLVGAATNFITNLANESLAFLLADAGADVWLGNSRGNIYSTNHTHLDPHQEEFWKFSWDEMAKYDLPAMIKFIVKKTLAAQVYYVGHSQGTTIGFAQFGEDEELASYIKHFFAFAPVSVISHSKTPLLKLAPYAQKLSAFYNSRHHGRVGMNRTIQKFLAADVCGELSSTVCTSLIFMLCGYDYRSFNVSRIPVYLAHSPAGTSVNTFVHWAQIFNSGKFQKFDYGSADENNKNYGQATPPIYHPSRIKIPVSIFRGGNDWMSDARDVKWLTSRLKNVANDVNINHYAHLDFIWAVDAAKLIYKKILNVVFS